MMFRDELDLAEYDFDPIYWQDREKLKDECQYGTVFSQNPNA